MALLLERMRAAVGPWESKPACVAQPGTARCRQCCDVKQGRGVPNRPHGMARNGEKVHMRGGQPLLPPRLSHCVNA